MNSVIFQHLPFKLDATAQIRLVLTRKLTDKQVERGTIKMKEDTCLFSIILFVVSFCLAHAEYEGLCSRFANGVQFRQPGNCRAYVTCTDGVGVVTTCPGEQLYNKDTQKCVATLTDSYCGDRCKSMSGKWVSDQATCAGYYYCSPDGPVYNYCTEGYHFNEKSQMCIFDYNSDCIEIPSICDVLPNSVPYSDPENCKKYYQCTKGVPKSSACKTDYYFDAISGECRSKLVTGCNAVPITTEICGKNSNPKYNVFISDGSTCRGYFYCAYMGPTLSDKNPQWNHCPDELFFDGSSQSCRHSTTVSCSHNRCEGRGNELVIAEDFGCRNYYACENSFVLEKRKCKYDMFFDEGKQACVVDETSYPVCDP